MKKITSLVFVQRPGEILLGYKKRGFGSERWNGFGGKHEPGETSEQAAARELNEESGLTANKLELVAELHFDFETIPDTLDCSVYVCHDFSGEPVETDEMRPQWFKLDQIPYAGMWTDDIHWLPRVLAGEKLEATFHFKDLIEVLSYDLQPLKS